MHFGNVPSVLKIVPLSQGASPVLIVTQGHSSLQKERPYLFPQQAAQHGTEPHNTGFLHPFVVYLYLIHLYFSLISFISKSIFLYTGKVNLFSSGDGGVRYLRPQCLHHIKSSMHLHRADTWNFLITLY